MRMRNSGPVLMPVSYFREVLQDVAAALEVRGIDAVLQRAIAGLFDKDQAGRPSISCTTFSLDRVMVIASDAADGHGTRRCRAAS